MHGKRVCYHHGGAKGSGRPISTYTGLLRYSAALTDPEERALYEQYRDDPHLDELGNEIALARMKLARYLTQQAGSLDQLTLNNVMGFADTVSKIVERRHKITYGESVTIRTKDFDTLADKLLEVAERIYGSDERYKQFLAECRGISLAASARATE